MARLESQSKMLYYPTPAWVVERIATHFAGTTKVRLADPCCGKGEALALFAQRIRERCDVPVETWGVELSYARAEAAEKVLDVVLPTSFYAASWSDKSVSFTLDNAPYDWSDRTDEKGKKLRHELLFVQETTPRIVPGGHQVIIVPRMMLGEARLARHLAGWYEQCGVYRFPDADGDGYEAFKQVVIFAIRRRERYQPPGKDEIEALTALEPAAVDIPVLVEGDGEFIIPPSPGPAHFTYSPATPDDLVRAARKVNPLASSQWARATYVRPLGQPFEVAMPLQVGHMTNIISGGLMGVLPITTAKGPALMKGMSFKVEEHDAEDRHDDEGEYSSTHVESRERLRTIVTLALAHGELVEMTDPTAVGDLIVEHHQAIGTALQARYRPTYNYDPTLYEWSLAGRIGLGLPPLPGRSERGPFDVQKHFGIAAARVMRKRRHAILNCSMGFGKGGTDSTKLLTPTGWTTFGKIKVGDRVIGSDGNPHTVIGVYPRGKLDVYRVTFSDGSSVVCDEDHLWAVSTPYHRWQGRPYRVMSLREIRRMKLTDRNGNRQFFIPMVAPVEFEGAGPLPLHPYLLGYLLGDGAMSRKKLVTLSAAEEETVRRLTSMLPDGDQMVFKSRIDWRIRGGATLNALRQLGLQGKKSYEKWIPERYLFAPIADRVALLQGLLDSDGSVHSVNNHVEFVSTSEKLARDVVSLVQSLGGTARLARKEVNRYTYKGESKIGLPSWRVSIALPNGIRPFLLGRKATTYRGRVKYAPSRSIVSITPVGRENVTCIAVDAPDHLYVTDDFIVTHNTLVQLIALYELGEWPALILCPGHMVEKHRRDAELSGDPGDPVAARIITRPARAEKSRWHESIAPAIESSGGCVVETTRTQVAPVTVNDPGGRRRVVVECAMVSIEEIAKTLKRLCTFRDNGKTVEPAIQLTTTGLVAEFVDRDDYTLFDFADDYRAGRLGQKAVAIVGFEPAKYDAGQAPITMRQTKRLWDEEKKTYVHKQVNVCPSCGAFHQGSPPAFCDHLIVEQVYDPATKKMALDAAGRMVTRARTCGAALFNFNHWRRIGLSRLVQRKFKNFFRVYVADEVHKAMNGRSDIGCADSRLLSAVPYSLALTGTLFGGAAGSLFHLLYRRNHEVRQLYGYGDLHRWIDHFGLWKKTWSQDKPFTVGERGVSTGIERWNYRQSELAGVGPGVIRFLLPLTLFGDITDLGFQLPPVYEHVNYLSMTAAQKEQYQKMDSSLLAQAMSLARQDHDPGGLSAWYTATRFRPNSAFRHEVIEYRSKRGEGCVHIDLPPVITDDQPFLPKEKRLARIVRRNARRGRKTLVFVEQTAGRDIRERLRHVLETLAGAPDAVELAEIDDERVVVEIDDELATMSVPIRVESLSSDDLSPRKREAWIRMHAPNMEALLVNPKLVETGLDLIMFGEIIFYELNTSLYVVWQSMRRVWRLGQKHEVHVWFLVYRDTCEDALLQYMGVKMKHALLLYGKEATGSLVEADDDDDFQRARIRAAMKGVADENAGEAVERTACPAVSGIGSLFTTGQEAVVMVDESPAGSPVATSPVLQPVASPPDEVMQLDLFGGRVAASAAKSPRGRKRTPASRFTQMG